LFKFKAIKYSQTVLEKGVYYLRDTNEGGTEFGFEKYIVKEFRYRLT